MSSYFAICYDCGKWYLTITRRIFSRPEFVNTQQRKFYMITRMIKIANVAVAAIVMLIILGIFIGD